MNSEEIKKYVGELILLSLDNQEIENPKVDFKFIWHDLKSEMGKAEFFKDISAIANTVGLDGFIIFGYDEKSKQFKNASFIDCGLRDDSELYSLVAKHVEGPIDFAVYPIEVEGHYLNIIHIPPSLGKPHLIKRHKTFNKDGTHKLDHEHRVFVRKGTSIHIANKYDLDFMYYDRKNIIPEYEVYATVNLSSLNLKHRPESDSNGKALEGFAGSIYVTFENTGRRPISLAKIIIKFAEPNYLNEADFITIYSTKAIIEDNYLLLSPNRIVDIKWEIFSHSFTTIGFYEGVKKMYDLLDKKRQFQVIDFSIITTHGKIIKPVLNSWLTE